PEADRLIRLAEVLPALGVADNRPIDAELDEHRCRDLAGIGPLALPMDVLSGDRDLRVGERLNRGCETGERRADRDVEALRLAQRTPAGAASIGLPGGGR